MHKKINRVIMLMFLGLLLLWVYLATVENISLKLEKIVVVSILTLVFTVSNKWTWFGALILCLYGVFDSRFAQMFGYLYFSEMGFFEPIYLYFDRNLGYGNIVLFLFPYVFYYLVIIYLLLPSTRKFYSFEKGRF